MLKLLSLSLVTSVLLLAEGADTKELKAEEKIAKIKKKVLSKDEKILSYEKKRVLRNPNLELKNIEIFKKVDFDKGWSAYVFALELYLKREKQSLKTQDILFTDGNVVTMDLSDIKTARSLKDSITVDAPEAYHDDEHFLLGNKNAKNKLLVFSDPLCPFCMDFVPDIIKFVKENSKDFALYYYHFPIISIHPASEVLIKASMVAKKKGISDIVERLYAVATEFPARDRDEAKLLKMFNEKLKTNITLDEIKKAEISQKYGEDIQKASQIMVKGTPTLFINGKVDKSKRAYLDLVKKEVK